MTQIKQLFKFSLLLVCCGLLASCDNENGADNLLPDGKYPIVFSTAMEGLTTRATVDGTWDGGEQVQAIINGQPAQTFTAAADGTLTPNTLIYWRTAYQTINVHAWSPATWKMQDNQSTLANYQAADFILAETTNISYANRNTEKLTFSHKMAKVTATLIVGEGIADLTGADVYFFGYTHGEANTGTITGNTNDWIKSYNPTGSTFNALLIPNSLTAQKFLVITLGGFDYYYTPATLALEAGKSYTFNITVSKTGLTVNVTSTPTWTIGNIYDVPGSYETGVTVTGGSTWGSGENHDVTGTEQ
jgi:hypothetical protein